MKRHKCDDVISGAVCSVRIQRKWMDLTFRALIVYDDSLSGYEYQLHIFYVYSTCILQEKEPAESLMQT